jgi:dipeptidyl aminopeptidase/acylaminoacyl peptidase
VKAAADRSRRTGIIGWSYGGYMTMWAVTQTTRFKAAVAGAGIANCQSYYGPEQDRHLDAAFFGASVYDKPEAYSRSSPIDVHQESEDADARAARRSRFRSADAAGLRVLARAESDYNVPPTSGDLDREEG